LCHVPLPFRRTLGILNPNFGITILNSLNVVKVSLTEVKDGAVRHRHPHHIRQPEYGMPCALKISEAASLAMHALGYLAKREDGPITSREIASRFEISEAHLAKVLQRLVKVELLHSVRGPRGGFTLTRSPESVTLLEIFEAIEGRFEPSQCLLSSSICEGDDCILGRILVEANTMLRARLEETNLLDVEAVINSKQSPASVSIESTPPARG
jgi:Rrf2 family protein